MNHDTAVVPSSTRSQPLDPAQSSASPQRGSAYLASLGALVQQAVDTREVEALADALAWTIARLFVAYGVYAAGDILKRSGGYMLALLEHERAKEEAARARKEGRPLQ